MPVPGFTYQDKGAFPLAIPAVHGAPVEWPSEDIAALAALAPAEFQKHILAMLRWYVKEDDVQLDLPGNEYWVAGYHQANALLAANDLRLQAQSADPQT